MTIKEVESLTGMTRANIRFYESRGLLSPNRGENGYREYTEEDVAVLQRIKLLRMLDLSLDEIQKLQAGEEPMDSVLSRHLRQLDQEGERITHCREICAQMKADKVQYQTLNAGEYLQKVNQSQPENQPEPQWKEDVLPRVRSPFRRFFARGLDLLFYGTLWQLFLIMVLDLNLSNRGSGGDLLDAVMQLLLMLVLEPVFLCLLGTTPGKWILGLRVAGEGGKHLTLAQARSRTWKVFFRGMGLGIPIYNLVRHWKSYRACADGEILDWEEDSTLLLRDEKQWRTVVWVGTACMLVLSTVLAMAWAQLPKHRGDLTVAQFSENYNRYCRYYGFDGLRKLDEEGNWVENQYPEGTVVVDVVDNLPLPPLEFEEENGVITGISFTLSSQNGEEWISGYDMELLLLVDAFAGAQWDRGLFDGEIGKFAQQMEDLPFSEFEGEIYGVRVFWEVEYNGYIYSDDWTLIPDEEKPCQFTMEFSMTK